MARSVVARHEAKDRRKCLQGDGLVQDDVSYKSISVQMLCPENVRLRQLYEAALRRWEQSELSSKKGDLSDASRRLALDVEKKALEERNAANERMVLHEQSCTICNRGRKTRRSK
jgi:hypothetical protein